MRKSTAALSALALSALVLTGCSTPSAPDAGCERGESAALTLAVTANGDIGNPKVGLTAPIPTNKVITSDLITGKGQAVRDSKESVVGTIALLNGTNGQMLDQGVGVWSADTLAEQFGGAGDILTCVTEGSRVAFALPAKDLPEGMAGQLGLDNTESIAGVLDVQAVVLSKAQGRDVFQDAHGVPSVVRAADGRPGVIIPDSPAPKKQIAETLIAGDGKKVGDGMVMFHYTTVGWNTRQVVSTSWDGSVVLDPAVLPESVMAKVKNATVGSQLLVVEPSADGNATVFVVDVLGLVPSELVRK